MFVPTKLLSTLLRHFRNQCTLNSLLQFPSEPRSDYHKSGHRGACPVCLPAAAPLLSWATRVGSQYDFPYLLLYITDVNSCVVTFSRCLWAQAMRMCASLLRQVPVRRHHRTHCNVRLGPLLCLQESVFSYAVFYFGSGLESFSRAHRNRLLTCEFGMSGSDFSCQRWGFPLGPLLSITTVSFG